MRLFNRKPKDEWAPEQIAALEDKSLAWLEQQQQKLIDEFNMGQYERFDVNPQTAELIYSDAGVPKVVANIQFAGTLATNSDSWLWSWANESMPAHLKQELLKVKQFGEEHKIYPLINRGFGDVDDTFCYTLTAVAAKLLNAKGVYRSPSPNGYAYLILTDVRWA